MLVDPENWTYECYGYNNLHIPSDYFKLQNLTHNKHMSPYCKYYHQERHVITDCPSKNAKQTCCNCGESGYIGANCPGENAHKKIKAKEQQLRNFVFDLPRISTPGSKRRRHRAIFANNAPK
ncbi:hypothetical protein EDC96DRAFT_585517 [Choanephora cucurbitarum]|nr:hypothetical protein EDC96DRAFT_569281 [Choanephora cucurbitarum]KAI8329568.1 hypothetical protein EDC96DRAFT_569283 [Choanephora cucurbitarum]KAI8329571.1 hypothetical protein EDC96DRAFT_585517 [Choanephora cucurbitarum]